MEYVVLVNPEGEVLGTEEKIAAHEKGLLHKAFSVFIFNEDGEMLLQQRAFTKYHFGGLWSNSCCSHPRLNEADNDAAHRRMVEELGFDTELKEVFQFIYQAKDEQTQLVEHELDKVFVGFTDRTIEEMPFNPEEVAALRWISISDLYQELALEPDRFSFWFKTALHELRDRGLLALSELRKYMAD